MQKTNKNLGKQIRFLVSGECLDEKMGCMNNRRFRQSLILHVSHSFFFGAWKTTRSVWDGTIYGSLSCSQKKTTFLLLGNRGRKNSCACGHGVSKTIHRKDWRKVAPMDPAKQTTRRWTNLSFQTKNVTNVLKISSARHPRFEAFSIFLSYDRAGSVSLYQV
jgi:hypothetical protein